MSFRSAKNSQRGYPGVGTRTESPGSHSSRKTNEYASLVLAVRMRSSSNVASPLCIVSCNRIAAGEQPLVRGLIGQRVVMSQGLQQIVGVVGKPNVCRVRRREVEHFPTRKSVLFQSLGIAVGGKVPGCAMGKHQWEFRSVTMRPYSDERPTRSKYSY